MRSRDSAVADDAAYRRGTVFGLTLAEVFILLLFLLLLLFLSLNQEWEIQADKNNDDAERALSELRAERDAQAQNEKEQRDRIRTLKRKLEDARQKFADQKQTMQEAQAAMEAADERVARAEKLLSKGENPPCWYHRIDDGKGGEREKPYYSFDAGVFDDHLIVRRLEPPEGGAVDDNGGSFADEAEALGFQALPYDRKLSDMEFRNHFAPISRAGKDAQVRTYSCVFWVRVWDQTARDAKTRWKQAHDGVLEGLFGTYQVQDDPWPP